MGASIDELADAWAQAERDYQQEMLQHEEQTGNLWTVGGGDDDNNYYDDEQRYEFFQVNVDDAMIMVLV